MNRCKAMIGVGGIGTGSFFLLEGNTTLGREESRAGRFIDRRDYCKLHIISHYVKALLGRYFAVIPIGKVGRDGAGDRLLEEMAEAGLDVRYVGRSETAPTLFSFCFVYPDGSGGNMTTADSACSEVDMAYVTAAEAEFARYEGAGVALAAPEAPMETRQALLDLGAKHGFLCVAAFTSKEISDGLPAGMLQRIDLLALNIDEAAAVAGVERADHTDVEIVEAAVGKLREVKSNLLVTITASSQGSWSWNGRGVHHVPVFEAEAAGTAGAGDAHLAGTIAGMVAGLRIVESHRLGALVAAMSVTSPHTINKEISPAALARFAEGHRERLSPGVIRFLEERK